MDVANWLLSVDQLSSGQQQGEVGTVTLLQKGHLASTKLLADLPVHRLPTWPFGAWKFFFLSFSTKVLYKLSL
jgi:hypothetical protein